MADFITIRRRDTSAEPLLAPNQTSTCAKTSVRACWYRAGHPASPERDLQAIAGNRVHRVRAYFDTTDPATKAFPEELDSLSQQSISMDVPDQLKSQPLLEKVMQTRVRNLMTQSPAAHREG